MKAGLRRLWAFSFPLALVTALALLSISELSYQRSTAALEEASQSFRVRLEVERVLRLMVDAETGQRGYLLTGKEDYLEPYAAATKEIGSALHALAGYYAEAAHRAELGDFEALARAIEKKISELDLTITLRREGRDEAWQAVTATDIGRETQQTIRAIAKRLADAENRRLAEQQRQVGQTLLISRLGVGTMTVLSVLAFHFYLRQARELVAERERKRAALQAERDKLEAQVERRTRDLTVLARHLQTMQEAERSHLARELHDELGALLTSAKLDVARLRSRLPGQAPEVTERLGHLNEALNSGIALKRRIIEDLRPSALGHLGLVASLEILTREFAQRSGLAVHTQLAAVRLSDSAKLSVYRFVQEALTNIAKYAKATRVDVRLREADDGVELAVQDDGCGFDPQMVQSSAHGLAGLQFRVEAEGGRMRVNSAAGEGTRLTAWMPVDAAA